MHPKRSAAAHGNGVVQTAVGNRFPNKQRCYMSALIRPALGRCLTRSRAWTTLRSAKPIVKPSSNRFQQVRSMGGDPGIPTDLPGGKGEKPPPETQKSEHEPVGLQHEMETQPITKNQPQQPGDEDVIPLGEYKAAGKLKDMVAVITGGDSGIGRSVAVLMAMEGAQIAINYLEKEQKDAEETKRLVEKEGRKILLLPGDLQQEQTSKNIVDAVVKEYGRINILVNNAAIQYEIPSIEDTNEEVLLQTFRTNVFSMFFMCKYAVPHMPKGSAIVNSTSIVAYKGSAEKLEYSATKGAITAFTRSLSQQLIKRGIRVNGVAAGPVHTPLNSATRDKESMEKFLEGSNPMNRVGQPSELGPAYVFLASPDASFISGQVIHANGGVVVGS